MKANRFIVPAFSIDIIQVRKNGETCFFFISTNVIYEDYFKGLVNDLFSVESGGDGDEKRAQQG